MPRTSQLNSSVTTVIIENNVQKAPTAWADEARAEIMKFIVVTSSSADPKIREQAMDYRAKLEQHIFATLVPIFRRAITAERMTLRKD